MHILQVEGMCPFIQSTEGRLLNHAIFAEKDQNPASVAYLSYLDKCMLRSHSNTKNLEHLFEYFQLYDIKCDAKVAQKINDVCRKLDLNAQTATVSNKGICRNCKQKLQKVELNEQEFGILKTAIFKNVIIGKNVFYKTTPEEIRKFQSFIQDMKKYDVVIDGLNVAYSMGTKQSPKVFSSLLAAVVQHFVDRKKQILVLGRTHMRQWPKANWLYVTQHADTFLAQTLSQDDPYLLYCALNCGVNTVIVTRDLMRSHIFKLHDPRLKLLFNRWLTVSQYQLQHVNFNQGKVFFKYPSPYSRTAHKLDNWWHIPYDEKLNHDTIVEKWLCLNI